MKEKGFTQVLLFFLMLLIISGTIVGISYYVKNNRSANLNKTTPNKIINNEKIKNQEKLETTESGIISDKSANWKIYSSGWFEYTFKYPNDAHIRNANNHVASGSSVQLYTNIVDIRDKPLGQIPGLYCEISVFPIGYEFETIIEKPDVTVTFNNISWLKEKYISPPVEFGSGEYKGALWQTKHNDFLYTIKTEQSYEQDCETVMKTFSFEVNSTIPSAVEAKNAKDAALVYIKSKYPNKKFIDGGFVINNKDNEPDVLITSDKARVIIADSGSSTRMQQSGIELAKEDGKWVVKNETKDF